MISGFGYKAWTLFTPFLFFSAVFLDVKRLFSHRGKTAAFRSKLPLPEQPQGQSWTIANLAVKWSLIGSAWWSCVMPEPITVAKGRELFSDWPGLGHVPIDRAGGED